jgi:hypothetical protein
MQAINQKTPFNTIEKTNFKNSMSTWLFSLQKHIEVPNLINLINTLQGLIEAINKNDSAIFSKQFDNNEKITLTTNFETFLSMPKLTNESGQVIYGNEKNIANRLYELLNDINDYAYLLDYNIVDYNIEKLLPLEKIIIKNSTSNWFTNLLTITRLIINMAAQEQQEFLSSLDMNLMNICGVNGKLGKLDFIHNWYTQILHEATQWNQNTHPIFYATYKKQTNTIQEQLNTIDMYLAWLQNKELNGILKSHDEMAKIIIPGITDTPEVQYLLDSFPGIAITINTIKKKLNGYQKDIFGKELPSLASLHTKLLPIIPDEKYPTLSTNVQTLSALAQQNIEKNSSVLSLFFAESNGFKPDIIREETTNTSKETNNLIQNIYEHISISVAMYKKIKDLVKQPQTTLHKTLSIDTAITAMQETADIFDEVVNCLSKELISHEFIMQQLQDKNIENILKTSFLVIPSWIYPQEQQNIYDPSIHCFTLYDLMNFITTKHYEIEENSKIEKTLRLKIISPFITLIHHLIDANNKTIQEAHSALALYLDPLFLALDNDIPDQQKINQLSKETTNFINSLIKNITTITNYIASLKIEYPSWPTVIKTIQDETALKKEAYDILYQKIQARLKDNISILNYSLDEKNFDFKNLFNRLNIDISDKQLCKELITAEKPTKQAVRTYWNNNLETVQERRNFCLQLLSVNEHTKSKLAINLNDILISLNIPIPVTNKTPINSYVTSDLPIKNTPEEFMHPLAY